MKYTNYYDFDKKKLIKTLEISNITYFKFLPKQDINLNSNNFSNMIFWTQRKKLSSLQSVWQYFSFKLYFFSYIRTDIHRNNIADYLKREDFLRR